MALLQFMTAGLPTTAVPVHRALRPPDLGQGRRADRPRRRRSTPTGRSTTSSAPSAPKYGIGFWGPGSGIIHQVVLENYAFPGGMMIGTDSHTPNAGGLGMVAIGVGGADAVDVMTGFPFNVRWPKVIGVQPHRLAVRLVGAEGRHPRGRPRAHRRGRHRARSSSTSARAPTASRPPARRPSATWAPRSAPPAACSATTTTWRCTSRPPAARRSPTPPTRSPSDLRPDDGALYDQLIEIDLDELKPLINGPHSPDRANRVGAAVGDEARANGWPLDISSALIGSCTNSSYEDITRAASIARQASARGLRSKTDLLVTPGSEQTRATIERDGLIADLEAIGATVLANACGPCIGQWDRPASDHGSPEHDRQLLQPQLPQAQRRLGQHAQLRHLARHGHRARAVGPARLRPDHRHASPHPTAPRCKLDPPVGEVLPDQGLRPRREHVHASARRRLGRRGRGLADQRPPAAAAAVPGVGRQRLPRPADPDEGQGQVHHRPHLGRRQVADVPRPPREHLAATCSSARSTRSTDAVGEGKDFRDGSIDTYPEPRQEVRRGRRSVVRDRRPQLRRGLVARARGDGAAVPRRRGDLRPQLRPHPRDQPEEAGPRAADVRRSAHLRPDRRGRPDQRARPAARARPERALPDRQARRHAPSTSRACTRSATSRSSGSGPARRSTSCAARSPKAAADC